jgi:GTP-binding protein Era
MVRAAWSGAADADAILVMTDAAELSARKDGLAARDTQRIVDGLNEAKKRAALVLNKIDAIKREALLPLADRFGKESVFERIFMVSALKGEGLSDLRRYCAEKMPPGPWLYPEDQAADIPLRLLAAEVTREKLMLRLHDELPYASTVLTESWKEEKDGSARIDQIIYVEKPGQKGIVIGKGGATIKAIGEAARREMEELFGRRVHLFLHTKVKSDWGESPAHYQEWGLEFPRG